MNPSFKHPWGWTTLAPLACAVHCALMPMVVWVAPSVLLPGTSLEWGLLVLTLGVAFLALRAGARNHGDLRPALPILAGIVLWTLSLSEVFLPLPEELTTTVSSLTVATGLFWNSRLHCALTPAECPGCLSEGVPSALSCSPREDEAPIS